jgi:hypothetical protein
MHSRIVCLLVLGLCAGFAAGCASPSPYVAVVHDANYSAAGIHAIEVENQNGRITVAGWDRDEVRVRALNGRGIENISVEPSRERIAVRTRPSSVVGSGGPAVEYRIDVPRSLSRIGLTTSNGAVEVGDCNGTIDARTSNGAIRLTGTRTIEGLATSNGAIDAEIRLLESDARVTTSNGAVRLRLAPALNTTLDARTSNGRVSVEGLPFVASVTGANEVRGTLGTGGPRLTIETSNGRIDIGPLGSVSTQAA